MSDRPGLRVVHIIEALQQERRINPSDALHIQEALLSVSSWSVDLADNHALLIISKEKYGHALEASLKQHRRSTPYGPEAAMEWAQRRAEQPGPPSPGPKVKPWWRKLLEHVW